MVKTVSAKNPFKTMFKGTSVKKHRFNRPEGAGNFDNMDDMVMERQEIDASFVKKAGDTMTGPLKIVDSTGASSKFSVLDNTSSAPNSFFGIRNNNDEDTYFDLQAGETSDNRFYVRWRDFESNLSWSMGKNGSNSFILFNTGSTHILECVENGITNIHSAGTSAVVINGGTLDSAGGTGGLIIKDGGSTRNEIGKITTSATVLGNVGTTTIGNTGTTKIGGASNHIEIDSGGSTVFVGTAGLAYGGIQRIDNTVEHTITTAGVATQVLIFDTNCGSNNTSPDHTNDHITIDKDGFYLINCSATINSVSGSASRFEISVQKNNGSGDIVPHMNRNIAGGGGASGVISMCGIADLSAGDTVEVWLENETNTQNYIVEDIDLNVVQLGGT